MYCPVCGANNDQNAKFCYVCGTQFRPMAGSATEKGPPRGLAVSVGAILILLSGLLGILNGVYFISPGSLGSDPSNITWLGNLELFGYLTIAASSIAIVGGFLAWRRSAYALCVAGGFLGALSLGFTAGYFLGLVGMMLVGFKRKEFVKDRPDRLGSGVWHDSTWMRDQK